MNKKSRNILIIGAIAAALIIVAAWPFMWWSLALALNPNFSLSPLDGQAAGGWAAYEDSNNGYAFKYPKEFKVVDNSASPTLDGALSEIVVEKSGKGKPDVLLTIFMFDEPGAVLGGVDLSLGDASGSIGCNYGGDCTVFFGEKSMLVTAKFSPDPTEIIDYRAKNILSTMTFFEGERARERQIKETVCREFVCEDDHAGNFKFAADDSGIIAVKSGIKIEKTGNETYKAEGFYYAKDKTPVEGGVVLVITRQDGEWMVVDTIFE